MPGSAAPGAESERVSAPVRVLPTMAAADLPSAAVIAGTVATGAIAATGAISKALAPDATLALAGDVTGSPSMAMTMVVGTLLFELGMAVAIAFGWLRGWRAVAIGLIMMLAFAGWLAVARHAAGGARACGCISLVARATIDQAIVADLVVAAILAGILARSAPSRSKLESPGGR
jgi:hypothetical protein